MCQRTVLYHCPAFRVTKERIDQFAQAVNDLSDRELDLFVINCLQINDEHDPDESVCRMLAAAMLENGIRVLEERDDVLVQHQFPQIDYYVYVSSGAKIDHNPDVIDVVITSLAQAPKPLYNLMVTWAKEDIPCLGPVARLTRYGGELLYAAKKVVDGRNTKYAEQNLDLLANAVERIENTLCEADD